MKREKPIAVDLAAVRWEQPRKARAPIAVVRAASGEDRTAQLVDWIARLLDTAPPKAQG